MSATTHSNQWSIGLGTEYTPILETYLTFWQTSLYLPYTGSYSCFKARYLSDCACEIIRRIARSIAGGVARGIGGGIAWLVGGLSFHICIVLFMYLMHILVNLLVLRLASSSSRLLCKSPPACHLFLAISPFVRSYPPKAAWISRLLDQGCMKLYLKISWTTFSFLASTESSMGSLYRWSSRRLRVSTHISSAWPSL